MLQASETTTDQVFSPQEERIKKGEPIGLVGDLAKTKRARIHKMLEGFREKPIRLNVERARLLTESMKDTINQPMILRWAKALSHILHHFPIHIDDNELILEIDRIKEALQQLPDGFRTVLSLYLFEGYDHREIAEILEISESTSKSQYNRAKKRLKEILKERVYVNG